jgi:chromosome segregation ATPase
MSKTSVLIASAAFCAAISFNSEAKLYKWVDADGVTQYGETIPPEYANRDTKILDKGRVTDRSETFDDKKKSTTKKETAEDRAALEAKRKDEALLNSFTTEKEIDLARDRALLQIEARINSFTTLIKSAQSNLDDLHKESEKRTDKGLKIPQSLTDDIADAEARVAKLQKDLDTNQKEFDAVTARYASEKKRFRELKGKEPLSK